MQVLESHPWIARAWTNNNAESYNHVLKSKTQWKQLKRVTDLIDNVHGLVEVPLKDLRRVGLPLTSSLLLEYSSEYLNEYSSTR